MLNPYLLMIMISIAVTVAYGAGRYGHPLWQVLAFSFSMQLVGYYVMSTVTSTVLL